MGRPRTIYVDADQLLLAIHRLYQSDLADLRAKEARHSDTLRIGWSRFPGHWELTCLEDDGLKIDFERLADRGLSSSERARHQEALRNLERANLVRIYGLRASRVKVTYLGLSHLRAAGLIPPETEPTEPTT